MDLWIWRGGETIFFENWSTQCRNLFERTWPFFQIILSFDIPVCMQVVPTVMTWRKIISIQIHSCVEWISKPSFIYQKLYFGKGQNFANFLAVINNILFSILTHCYFIAQSHEARRSHLDHWIQLLLNVESKSKNPK